MTWLDALLDRGREAKTAHAPHVTLPKPVVARAPRPKPEIKTVWMQTRAPRDEGDPGAAEPGFYSVADGVVTMHDENGKPTGQRQELGPNDDPHLIAGRLKRAAWLNTNSDFNRRLRYPPLSIA
jgi:hypothetical protein